MRYTHFAPIGPRRWAVLSGSRRVAEIALDNRHRRFTITANRATPEDLDAIQTFMQDTKDRLGIFWPCV